MRNPAWSWTGLAVSGALVAACYGFVLGLPFFFDDLPVMTWLGGHSLWEVWTTSSENAYYRPLTFTVYRFGLSFPKGTQQVILHGANLLLHWLNAFLVLQVLMLCEHPPKVSIQGRYARGAWRRDNPAIPRRGLQRFRSRMSAAPGQALLGMAAYAVFPFLYRAVPWVTAMPHLLVLAFTLVATYAALRAEEEDKVAWWALSLSATALAPFAHESGIVGGAIVAGVVAIQYGPRLSRNGIAGALLGVLFNGGAVWLRGQIPGVGGLNPDGLNSVIENITFFLHGLVYPVGPVIGELALRRGWHDLTLVQTAAASFGLALLWLAARTRDGPWVGRGLWWWACGALPAAIRFRYGGLVNSPRFYALASVGIVMLWSGAIARMGKVIRPAWGQRLAWGVAAGAILLPNVLFIQQQSAVYLQLNQVYREVLKAAQDERDAPLGFVNVPAWLAPKDQTYALTKDGAVMLPLYTDIREFIGVNAEPRQAHNVMFVHTLQEPEGFYWGFHGDWLDWEQMRQFAIDHRSVWMARYERGQFVLLRVGQIQTGNPLTASEPLAHYTGGPVLERATTEKVGHDHWAVTLTWLASGPADGEVFVHVVDEKNALVTQADGPALGGMVPLRLWQEGDRIHDVRHITLPTDGGTHRVLVGLYNGSNRFPAYVNGTRSPDDAVAVDTIVVGRATGDTGLAE